MAKHRDIPIQCMAQRQATLGGCRTARIPPNRRQGMESAFPAFRRRLSRQTRISSRVRRKCFGNRMSGVTSIEYAILASLIAVGIVTGVAALGTRVSGMWSFVSSVVSGVM